MRLGRVLFSTLTGQADDKAVSGLNAPRYGWVVIATLALYAAAVFLMCLFRVGHFSYAVGGMYLSLIATTLACAPCMCAYLILQMV